jgi:hypothetical protein
VLNPFNEVNWSPDTEARRVFAKSLMVGLPMVAVVLAVARWCRTGVWDSSSAVVLGGAGFAVGALFYALPAIARPFYVVWYALACCVGLVVGNLLVAALYFIAVTGTGVLKRAFGQAGLTKSYDRQASTYWRPAPRVRAAADYFKQF